MKERIISALFMIPGFLFLIFGGVPLLIFTALLSSLAVYEFCRGIDKLGIKTYTWTAIAGNVFIYALILLTKFIRTDIRFGAKFGWFVLMIVLFLFFNGKNFGFKSTEFKRNAASALAVFYPGYLLSFVVMTERLENGKLLVWYIFITAFITDIFAYFTGYFFGKHKLCPKISPKKTIEGSVGGTLASIIACILYGNYVAGGTVWTNLFIGLFGAIVAQAGDLTASAFKRKMGIKDYGNLIPGHGGILDRFDSVSFTAPFVYATAYLLLYYR